MSVWSISGKQNYFGFVQSLLPTCSARKATQNDDKDLFHVTLACEDGRVQAHTIISGWCSSLLQHVLPTYEFRVIIKTSFMLLLLVRMIEFRHTKLFWVRVVPASNMLCQKSNSEWQQRFVLCYFCMRGWSSSGTNNYFGVIQCTFPSSNMFC